MSRAAVSTQVRHRVRLCYALPDHTECPSGKCPNFCWYLAPQACNADSTNVIHWARSDSNQLRATPQIEGKPPAKRRHFDAAEHSLRQHLTKIGRAKVSEARRVHARSCAVSITLPNHATGRSHHSVPECKEGKLGSQTTDLLLGLLDIATLLSDPVSAFQHVYSDCQYATGVETSSLSSRRASPLR